MSVILINILLFICEAPIGAKKVVFGLKKNNSGPEIVMWKKTTEMIIIKSPFKKKLSYFQVAPFRIIYYIIDKKN